MRPCPSPANLPLHWESVPPQSLELPPPGQPQEQVLIPCYILAPSPVYYVRTYWPQSQLSILSISDAPRS